MIRVLAGLIHEIQGYEVLGDCLMEKILSTWPMLKRENLDLLDEL